MLHPACAREACKRSRRCARNRPWTTREPEPERSRLREGGRDPTVARDEGWARIATEDRNRSRAIGFQEAGRRDAAPEPSSGSAWGGGLGSVSSFTDSDADVLVAARATHLPASRCLTWFSCISPSAARAARERGPRSARAPSGGAWCRAGGRDTSPALLASRGFLVRLASARNRMRHSVHVQRTRAHEPPRPPPARGAGRHGRLPCASSDLGDVLD